jgi:CheY-like chemotaxis protein
MAVVLLVEDEEQVRVLAESYLEEQGHKVLSGGTPQGAIVGKNATRQPAFY